jgi:hypothetical protein
LGTIQPKTKNDWFDQDCQLALDTRNEARKRMLQRGTGANTLEYADTREVEKPTCHRKKKEYEENIFFKTDILEMKYEHFRKGCAILRGFQLRITVCRDKIGNLIAGEQ